MAPAIRGSPARFLRGARRGRRGAAAGGRRASGEGSYRRHFAGDGERGLGLLGLGLGRESKQGAGSRARGEEEHQAESNRGSLYPPSKPCQLRLGRHGHGMEVPMSATVIYRKKMTRLCSHPPGENKEFANKSFSLLPSSEKLEFSPSKRYPI